MIRSQASFLFEFTFCCIQWIFIKWPATFWYFPGILIENKSVLPNKVNIKLIIQNQDSQCPVFKMNFSIDAIASGRIDHIIFRDPDPVVVVNFPSIPDLPGVGVWCHTNELE